MTVSPSKPYIGAVIRELREKEGWTQATLAEKIGTHQFYISAVERGNPRYQNMQLKRIEEFASAFNLHASDLLSMVNSQ